MNFSEKLIYHQIVPVKLAVDIVAGLAALPLCWDHEVLLSLAVGAGPPVVVSAFLLAFVDLEKYKKSDLGKKMKNSDPILHAARLLGFAISATGAWYHDIWVIAAGLGVIGMCWAIIVKK
ncbi:hypothetical protein HY988_07750 [Candidatus Micrarchaeota archaeon]|nr:hypothetical protein [Candidatus Micrarchaeota archaeon]